MSKYIKRVLVASSIIVIVVAVIATFFIVKTVEEMNNVEQIGYIRKYLNSIENVKETENTVKTTDLMLQEDEENIIGLVMIEKIKFTGSVYEGTSLNTLEKGVGHFENSPYLIGNVCLAAHQSKYWGELHKLQNGDLIRYESFLGTKTYEVISKTEIEETDWSLLENTEDNYITLITCIKNKPDKRLCVQAKEIKF